MALTVEQWHQRFEEQSHWTAPLRAFLFSQCGIEHSNAVLEVGCGTGAVTCTLSNDSQLHVTGIDFQFDRVHYAAAQDTSSRYACANALELPFPSEHFDIVYCHYFFLWLGDQAKEALAEMSRVTRKGGAILAIAEPDHLARLDYPGELEELGRLQTRSLVRQGACVDMGRKLPGLFAQAGLEDIRFGQSGFQNNVGTLPGWFGSEWTTYREDLHEDLTPADLDRLESIDQEAWLSGKRVLTIPTFYAIGIKR
jgi:SAM-dependent methyltransferase